MDAGRADALSGTEAESEADAEPGMAAEEARVAAIAGELRALIGRLRRRMREDVPAGGLTASQLAAMSRLETGGPATVSALARAEGVRSQSMGANIAALEAAGYVSGSPHPSDGRQTVLSLTPAARETIRSMRAAREDWLSRSIHAHLTTAEHVQLEAAVDLLKRLVDEPGDSAARPADQRP